MRKVRTAVLYKQVANSSSMQRTKEAFSFGAANAFALSRYSNCKKRIKRGVFCTALLYAPARRRAGIGGKRRLNPNFRDTPSPAKHAVQMGDAALGRKNSRFDRLGGRSSPAMVKESQDLRTERPA